MTSHPFLCIMKLIDPHGSTSSISFLQQTQTEVPMNHDTIPASKTPLHKNKWIRIVCKLILAACAVFVSFYAGFLVLIFVSMEGANSYLSGAAAFLPAALLLPMIFFKQRRKILKYWGIATGILTAMILVNLVINAYNDSKIINTTPNINVQEYLPFEEDSKIVTLDHPANLQLTEDLPILDGAAAVFPVYSAFVNAVYPNYVGLQWDGKLNREGPFRYTNTVNGYYSLAEKEIDIFFGAYPSKDQIQYAEEQGTHFEYTQIGSEAFVFFVHKDNPIDNLTSEQIRSIYSGQITNWSQVGGANKKIDAYQRNQGSGSQSMLVRFMGDTPLMDPPSELVNDLMSGIIEKVSDYRSSTGSIGFSFRYYVEGIIQNPDIKILSVDGVAPTVENIKNGSYPITTPLYAVTYAGNTNENVPVLLEWILSEEGQEIIERTGYAGVK